MKLTENTKLQIKTYLRINYTIKNIKQMSDDLDIDRHTVRNYLRKYQLNTTKQKNKNIGLLTAEYLNKEYVLGKRSSIDIGKEVGCHAQSVTNTLRNLSIPIRNHFDCNKKYSLLDLEEVRSMGTDEMAYFIGFITADGCVTYSHKENSERLVIQLSQKDEALLEKFKATFNLSHPVSVKNTTTGNQVRLEIKQPGLLSAFAEWNIEPRKTLIIKFPRNLRADKLGHYLRGLMDGDGCISFTQRNSTLSSVKLRLFTGSLKYAEGLIEVLEINNITVNNLYHPKKAQCWSVEISNKSFIKFYNLLYPYSDLLCLERKRMRFIQWQKHLDSRNNFLKTKTLNPNALLTWENINEIKLLHETGNSNKSIGEKFNVHPATIGRIINGDSYVRQN